MLLWILFFSVSGLANAQTPCSTLGATCASCTTINVCVDTSQPPVSLTCSRPTPYCNAGTCSAAPGAECAQASNGFLCPEEDGTYPDPLDCTKYHTCLRGVAYDYNCDTPNTVYCASSRSCVRRSPPASCYRVTCSGSRSVSYPGDIRLYFMCANSRPTIVQRCKSGQRFDSASQSCLTYCPREGRFPDPDGITTYLECTLTYNYQTTVVLPFHNLPTTQLSYTVVKRTCPENSTFNPTTLECTATTQPPTTGNAQPGGNTQTQPAGNTQPPSGNGQPSG